MLAGREEQQNRIRGYLSRIGTYGEMGGPLLVFQGPRGVGKTSLLREAQRDAEGHGFITAWVSCRRNAPFLPDLVSRIGKAIETADILPRAEKGRWGLRLERIGVEIGVPSVVKVSASASADRSEGDPPRGARISALEDLLHETSRQVRGSGGAGLVVFVDELHAAARDDLAVLLNAMQNLAGKREDNPFAVIGAGLPSAPAALVKAATFGERSTFLTLPRLQPAAAETAVAEPADDLGSSLDLPGPACGRGGGPGLPLPAAGSRTRHLGGGAPITCGRCARHRRRARRASGRRRPADHHVLRTLGGCERSGEEDHGRHGGGRHYDGDARGDRRCARATHPGAGCSP